MSVATEELTIEKISNLTKEKIKPLRDIGLMALPYAHGPLGKNIFTMALDQDSEVLRFWTGTADLKVVDTTTEPKKQAVIRVVESGHTLTFKCLVRRGTINYAQIDTTQQNIIDRAQKITPGLLQRLINTTLPPKTIFKVANAKTVLTNRGNFHDVEVGERFDCYITIEATVPAFDDSFLIGYDEQKCFISQLPVHVNKVKDAYKVLRPEGVSPKALRQGEWFFNPIKDPALIAKLNKIEEKQAPAADRRGLTGLDTMFARDYYVKLRNKLGTQHVTPSSILRSLARGSSHHANYIDHAGKRYVKGSVVDSRKARHAPLEIKTWHEVIRNLEKVMPVTARPRRWD